MESPRHEVVIDTAIADAYEAVAKARQALAQAQKHLDWSIKNNRVFDIEKNECVRDSKRAAYADAVELMEVREMAYEGWSRFFLVTNTNGHIHSSMSCSTCFADTDFAWLPELSGLTEADAVAEYGEILCSVCFKSAPVEWTTGTNKKVAAERELHKALVAIERSPEGKKLKSLRSSLSSKQYSLENAQRDIARLADWGDSEPVAYVVKAAAEAPAKIAKLEKQIAKYNEKIEAAQAALEEALKG